MAYQTSCVSYTSGRVGLSSATAVVADAAGREQTQHGSPLFPIACYAEDLSCYSVAWHWHEEFEFDPADREGRVYQLRGAARGRAC